MNTHKSKKKAATFYLEFLEVFCTAIFGCTSKCELKRFIVISSFSSRTQRKPNLRDFTSSQQTIQKKEEENKINKATKNETNK